METTLLLALFLIGSDENAAKSLKKFLRFYRENRELFSLVMGAPPVKESRETCHESDAPCEDDQKSRPEEVGERDILEEYLKKLSV